MFKFFDNVVDFVKAPKLGERLFGDKDLDRKTTDFIRKPQLGNKIVGGGIGRFFDDVGTVAWKTAVEMAKDAVKEEATKQIGMPRPGGS